jgi:5'-3' exonuclease
MDASTLILLDVNNLSHRNWHAAQYHGGRTDGASTTPVLYGLLRDLSTIATHVGSVNFVFCFDSVVSARKKFFPEYKNNREKNAEIEKELGALLWNLEQLGYSNVFSHPGAEADDIIAAICQNLPVEQTATIVSNDSDMWQLLRRDVVDIWNPIKKEFFTEDSLMRKLKITPGQWIEVKALTGCRIDCIPGIFGEKTAIRAVTDGLPCDSFYHKKLQQGVSTISRNLKLVTLPFLLLEMEEFPIVQDYVTPDSWRDFVMSKPELRSLMNKYPKV